MGNDFSTNAINKKNLNTKLKLSNGEIHTKFYINNGEPTKLRKEHKTDSPFSYYCILAIVFRSVCKIRKQDGHKYYPQIHLDKCMYTGKKQEKISIKRKLKVRE